MRLAEAVKRIREELGVSQQKLADRLKVTLVTVQRYESDQFQPASAVRVRLYRLAQEINRSDLAAVFAVGSAMVLDQSAGDLVLEGLPKLKDYVVDALAKLTEACQPQLKSGERFELTVESVEILQELLGFLDQIQKELLPG